MRAQKLFMVGAAAAGAAAALWVAPNAGAAKSTSAQAEAAQAANSFLAALTPELRKKASFALADRERLNWNFVPMKRAGVWLLDLDDAQAEKLGPLLASGLSPEGLLTARGVMKHENILRRVETERGIDATRRDPGQYYTAIFGTPDVARGWSWRFEGHHLSINVAQVPGQPAMVGPMFVGANPATVKTGPNAGFRLLANEEDFGRELVTMLAPEQRTAATIADKAFSEIVTKNDPKVELEPAGLAAKDMSPAAQAQLRRLVYLYLDRLNLDSALEAKRRMDRAGFGQVRFAWAGGIESGQPHYYRVHGPTLLIEYDDTQNDANHIHTVYRDLERDFGGDPLRAHYRGEAHDVATASVAHLSSR